MHLGFSSFLGEVALSGTVKSPSVEPVVRSKLLPRVSFRSLFALTTVAAVIAAFARIAGQGGAFAYAVMVAVGFVAAAFLMFAFMFVHSWLISLFWYSPDSDALDGSPFADGQLPPQILPPREPGQ